MITFQVIPTGKALKLDYEANKLRQECNFDSWKIVFFFLILFDKNYLSWGCT